MTRIEFGPEGNPDFVMDQDGSGNIELRDSDGNVIQQWAQDEFVSDITRLSVGNITTINRRVRP